MSERLETSLYKYFITFIRCITIIAAIVSSDLGNPLAPIQVCLALEPVNDKAPDEQSPPDKGSNPLQESVVLPNEQPVVEKEPLSSDDNDILSTYKVEKGDTLWDISKKIFHSSFLWPKIWQFNTEIKNPDDIQPGQIIKIPKYLDIQRSYNMPLSPDAVKEKETSGQRDIKIEAPKLKQAVKHTIIPKIISNLNEKNLILYGGYIAKELTSYGNTLTTPEGRTFAGTNDYLYVKTVSDDYPKYYIMRKGPLVIHPITGVEMGNLISFEGVLQIIGTDSGIKKAIVLDCYNEILEHDVLVPFFYFEPAPDISEKPFINGIIVYVKGTSYTEQFGIVYTDKGTADGVHPGDIFTVYSKTEPRQPLGKIKVLISQKDSSTAYVVKSSREIAIGSVF